MVSFLLQSAPGYAPHQPPGATQKIPVGAVGQVLTVLPDGSVGWLNNPAGFAPPMSGRGELITSGDGGVPVALAPGEPGEVLVMTGPDQGWIPAPWLVSPMLAPGDLIVMGKDGPQRLPAGDPGDVLVMTTAGPRWAPNPREATVTVWPSGDRTGATDRAAIEQAWARGRAVTLPPGAFYVNARGGLDCLMMPSAASLRGTGPGTVVYPVGLSVTGIRCHDPVHVSGLVVDGKHAPGAAYGMRVAPALGTRVDVTVRGFTGHGSQPNGEVRVYGVEP